MNPEAVEISHHALMRFQTRQYGPPVENPESEIRRLLAEAIPEDIGSVGRTLRLINNGFQPARYFRAEGWRFVVSEDGSKLMTCERRIYKGKQPKKRRNR